MSSMAASLKPFDQAKRFNSIVARVDQRNQCLPWTVPIPVHFRNTQNAVSCVVYLQGLSDMSVAIEAADDWRTFGVRVEYDSHREQLCTGPLPHGSEHSL